MANESEIDKTGPAPYWSPYVAGVGLGLTLLASYWFLGAGLGASAAISRCSAWVEHLFAPRHVEASAYFGRDFADGGSVLAYYLVAMGVGTLIGAFISALGARRIRPAVERGPNISIRHRLALALVGGVLVGFASRLARGCTSGQALSGTALLLSGSVAFMAAMFIAAFIAARLVRRQWR